MRADLLSVSPWQEVDEDDVQRRMGAELAELPTHETSTLHMVAGLLLPIWKQLPMNRPVSIGSRAMMASA
jgi:hypothetical protein